MNKLLNMIKCLLAVLVMHILLVSCGGGGSNTGGTGTLGIGLTDAPGDYDHVFVTIDEIQVKQGLDDGESGWLTGFTVGQTFDLLELQNGAIADLGLAELEAGQYNQIRLILASEPIAPHPFANYVVIEGEQEEEYIVGEAGEYYTIQELKVPSGLQTGIKIVQGFTIEVGGSTELILDFDAKKSIVQAGKSGKWLLKPTIKVLETLTYSVNGEVDTIVEEASVPINGVTVSAQINDPLTGDPNEERATETSIINDIEGSYFMYLPISNKQYNIVAIEDGYGIQCKVIDFTQPIEPINFTLTAEDSGTITASVTGVATADFLIRQEIDCGLEIVMIEVASVSVADGGTSDAISLPLGTYEVVISPAGEDPYVVEAVIETSGENISVDHTTP
jgi:hypothetical protein